MNKRGQGLPLNTLVIIILVVIVLIVVAVFFLGGTSSLSQSIRNIFYGATSGTDVALAREICDQRCAFAQDVPFNSAKSTAYCTSTFDIDQNNDGRIDSSTDAVSSNSETGIKCSDDQIGHFCNIRNSNGVSERLVC